MRATLNRHDKNVADRTKRVCPPNVRCAAAIIQILIDLCSVRDDIKDTSSSEFFQSSGTLQVLQFPAPATSATSLAQARARV